MRFRTLIRTRRIELGVSQHKLAKMLGYSSAQFISNIEAGRANLPKKKIRRICRGLLLDSRVVLEALQDDHFHELCAILGLKIR